MILHQSRPSSLRAHHTSRIMDSKYHHPHTETHHQSTSPLIHNPPHQSCRHSPGRSRNGPSRRYILNRRCTLSDRLRTPVDWAILQNVITSQFTNNYRPSRSGGRSCWCTVSLCQPPTERLRITYFGLAFWHFFGLFEGVWH